MFFIDSDKCTGCGTCVDVCPEGAISLQNNVAMIDQALCSKCGNCTTACPAGAIRARVPVYAELGKGGKNMYSRMGRGRGLGRGAGGGMGFGFRGSSPPWPYVGRGRGGLPRCGYYLSGVGAPPGFQPGIPATPAYAPYTPEMTREQELNYLKGQAEAVKEQLEEIESRIKQLSTEK